MYVHCKLSPHFRNVEKWQAFKEMQSLTKRVSTLGVLPKENSNIDKLPSMSIIRSYLTSVLS